MAKKSRSVSSSRYRSRRSTTGRTKGTTRKARSLLVLGIIVGVGFLHFEKLSQEDPKETLNVVPCDYSALTDMLDQAAVAALTELGIHPDWVKRSRMKKSNDPQGKILTRTRVRVPENLPLALCNLEVTRAVQKLGGRVVEGTENDLGTIVTLNIGIREEVTGRILLTKDSSLLRPEGRAALIVDDFGNGINEISNGFLNLDQPFTIAVLPHLKASEEVAVRAYEKGFEVILHLPLEPHNSQIDPGEGAVFVDMSPQEIRRRVQEALDSIPHIRGVNNHMGSKATENEDVMGTVMAEVKKKDLYWVDSVTSPDSKAYDVAKKMRLAAARSKMFIDSEPEIEKIEAKLERLYELATTQDSVIAIGHCRPLTLQVLKEALPKLEKRGITFVYVSDFVE